MGAIHKDACPTKRLHARWNTFLQWSSGELGLNRLFDSDLLPPSRFGPSPAEGGEGETLYLRICLWVSGADVAVDFPTLSVDTLDEGWGFL